MTTDKRLVRYEDFFDLPDNVVGKSSPVNYIPIPDRHRLMRGPVRCSVTKWGSLSIRVMAAAGGYSTNPSYT
jgi:hypothetical protein